METQLSQDMGDMWQVSIWKNNQWTIATKHRFKSDAEQVQRFLKNGCTFQELWHLCYEQNKTGVSIVKIHSL